MFRLEPPDYLLLISDLENSLNFKYGDIWLGLAPGDVKYENPIVAVAQEEKGYTIFQIFLDG